MQEIKLDRGFDLKNPPLALDDWRSRWLVLPSSNALHRISEIEWGVYSDGELEYMKDEQISGYGKAVCGAKGDFQMPGMFSRMGRPRCKHCCRLLGIPDGHGAPYNSYQEWADA